MYIEITVSYLFVDMTLDKSPRLYYDFVLKLKQVCGMNKNNDSFVDTCIYKTF